MQYLSNWRIQLATCLLRDGDVSVAAAAYQVGYELEEVFNRAFKRAMGRPPRVGYSSLSPRPYRADRTYYEPGL